MSLHIDSRFRIGPAVVLAAALLAVPALAATAQTMMAAPGVVVADQKIVDGHVVIQRVTSDGPGWIMIHADANGAPGPVLGYAAVPAGTSSDVQVAIDVKLATPVLYAMLHKDVGVAGKMEFPGVDAPVFVNGKIVSPSFTVTP